MTRTLIFILFSFFIQQIVKADNKAKIIENFIKGLTELVLQQETKGNFVSSVMCPDKYKKCPCLAIKN